MRTMTCLVFAVFQYKLCKKQTKENHKTTKINSSNFLPFFVFIFLFSQPTKLWSSHIPDINHSPPEVLTKENPFHTCFLDAIDQICPESCLIFKSNQKSICVRCGRCGRRNCWPGMFTFLTLSILHYMGHLIHHIDCPLLNFFSN